MVPGVEIAHLSGRSFGSKAVIWGLPILIVATVLHTGPLFFDEALRHRTLGLFGTGSMVNLVGLLLGLGLTHEAIHGLVLVALGDRQARLTVTWSGVAIVPGRRPQSRRRYLGLLLAPLAILLPVSVALSWLWLGRDGWFDLVLAGVSHAAGCSLDVYIARWIWTLPDDTILVNHYPEPLRAYRAVRGG